MAIGGESEGGLEAGINVTTFALGSFGANRITSLVKGEQKEMLKPILDGMLGTLHSVISIGTQDVLKKDEDKNK